MMQPRIKQLFNDAIEIKTNLADPISNVIMMAAQRLVNCLLNDHKILACGNGGSMANIQHFTNAMLHHFEVARPALPIIQLGGDPAIISSMANEANMSDLFAKQIQALGHNEDVLLIITTTGNSDNLLSAVNAANERGMDMIVFKSKTKVAECVNGN